MNTSLRTNLIAGALVVGCLVIAAPATAKTYTEPSDNGPAAAAQQDSGQAAATRDDAQAAIVHRLRRDPDQAVPFVADLGTPEATASGDEFDWGDAAIGAGTALLVVAFAVGGSAAIGRRGYSTPRDRTASQSA